MKYSLFLFDLDDTLLDFKASEKLSFRRTLESLGIREGIETVFSDYQKINSALWKQFEEAKTTKEHLKVERFRKTFELHKLELDPEKASTRYLDTLPETVVLIDHAVEICEWLYGKGEIGIITNGIHHVQTQRIKNSPLYPFIHFVSVSEDCGYAKPDVRFFEYTAGKAKNFQRENTIIIGDRLEADILGARNFGISGCWFNPEKLPVNGEAKPHYEIAHLSELKHILK